MAGGHFKREIPPPVVSSAIHLLDSPNNAAAHFPWKIYTERLGKRYYGSQQGGFQTDSNNLKPTGKRKANI